MIACLLGRAEQSTRLRARSSRWTPRTSLCKGAVKALKGLSLAREYMNYGFTTLRDLGSVDPNADSRSAQCVQCWSCKRTAALRRRAYHQRECPPRRPLWLLRFAPDLAGLSDDLGGIGALVRGASTLSAATGSKPPTPAA